MYQCTCICIVFMYLSGSIHCYIFVSIYLSVFIIFITRMLLGEVTMMYTFPVIHDVSIYLSVLVIGYKFISICLSVYIPSYIFISNTFVCICY